LLRELGVLPEFVLVMVLENECDDAAPCFRQAGFDALHHAVEALLARQPGPTLAGQHPAMRRAQLGAHPDPGPLSLYLRPASVRVELGEVGRAAEHRNHESARFDGAAGGGPATRILQLAE